jgi:phage shock protein A
MQEELAQLRIGVTVAISNQKCTEQRYEKAVCDEAQCHKKAQLALSRGNHNLAQIMSDRASSFAKIATNLKNYLDSSREKVESLKRNLILVESKIRCRTHC